MFLKVETLSVCCKSGAVSAMRSFESTELGTCLAVANAAVFVVFALSHDY